MNIERTQLFQEHLNWLFSQQHFLNPTLERTQALLAFLDNPQTQFETILVGGTNGKGSVVVSLAAMLQASGKSTARFVSPHLSYFAERFVVDGQSVSDEAILEVLVPLRKEAERIQASFFEIVTAMASKLFANAGVDYAIFEVGMGGRFDSTNSLDPVLSIVTNVSLDHTKVLGDTVEEIAADKAQIMRAGRPCFSAAKGEALKVLKAEAEKIGAVFTVLEDVEHTGKNLGWQGVEIAFKADNEFSKFSVQSQLLGEHQIDNVSLAVLAARALNTPIEAIQKGASTATWAGRLEVIKNSEVIKHKEQTFLLDGAHNQASARALARAITDLDLDKPVLVFGISGDKQIKDVVAELADAVGDVILCQAANSPRAAQAKDLVEIWSTFKPSDKMIVANELKGAIEEAIIKNSGIKNSGASKQTIVVAGSLYLIGEIRPLLLAEEAESWERWQ